MPLRSPPLALVLVLAALPLGGCSDDKVTALLVDGACRCDVAALRRLKGLALSLEGAASRAAGCIALTDADRLEVLQGALRSGVSLDGLGEGSYALTLLGYDDASCQGNVLACGHSRFALPGATAAIDIPIRCLRGSDGAARPISPQSCSSEVDPFRCSDVPGDDGGGGADSGTDGDATAPREAGPGTLELPAVTLSDAAACDNKELVHADSVAVALYAGATLRWRRCVRVSSPDTVAQLQKALPTPLLDKLDAGTYRLMFTAHDNRGCSADDVVACGGATVTLPTTSAPAVALTCHPETTPITESACQASLP